MSDKISEPASLSEERLRVLRHKFATLPGGGTVVTEFHCRDLVALIDAELSRRSQGDDSSRNGNDAAASAGELHPLLFALDSKVHEYTDGYQEALRAANDALSTPTASPSRQAADVQAQGEALDDAMTELTHAIRSYDRSPDRYTLAEIAEARDKIHAIALLQRQPSEPKAEAWQPIESAPRVPILVCGGTYTHDSGDYPVWPLETTALVCPGRRGTWVTNAEDGEYVYSPTHWQPLPAPPKRAEASGTLEPLSGDSLL
jgi:hypothetical protein